MNHVHSGSINSMIYYPPLDAIITAGMDCTLAVLSFIFSHKIYSKYVIVTDLFRDLTITTLCSLPQKK